MAERGDRKRIPSSSALAGQKTASVPGRRLRIPTRHETKTTTPTSSARRTADDDNDFSTVLTTYIRPTYSQFDYHRRRPGYPDAGSPKTPAETYRPESYARDVETKAPHCALAIDADKTDVTASVGQKRFTERE